MIESALVPVSTPLSKPAAPPAEKAGAADSTHLGVSRSLEDKPIVAVIRTDSLEQAHRQAELFIDGGLELIEVTFSVPEATSLVRRLLNERAGGGPPWIGMGTVTTRDRAEQAVGVGAELIVSPNTSKDVADVCRGAGLFFMLGALTATEIVEAWRLGSNIVKVYPLPPVGGPEYLRTVRLPLSDIPMLAGGGFSVEEIPDYLRAGASAFGIGPPLLGSDDSETRTRISRALELAGGGSHL